MERNKISIKINNNFWRSIVVSAFLFGLFTVFNSQEALAATKTWSYGGVNTNWSTAGNWTPSGAPVDGDDIVISSEIGTMHGGNNDIAGLTINNLTLSGSEISGPDITATLEITGDIVNTGTHKTISLKTASTSLILADDVQMQGFSFGGDAGANINLNGHKLTIVDANPANNHMIFSFTPSITGNGQLVINAPNTTIMFFTANTYSGSTIITASKGVMPSTGGTSTGINMFGSSDITVGTDVRLSIDLTEVSTGATWSNNITLLGSGSEDFGTWTQDYYSLNFFEYPQTRPLVEISVPNITLSSNVRLNSGTNILVNLAGVQSNGFCAQYGYDGMFGDRFQNGPPACMVDDTPILGTVPGVPNAGALKNNTVFIAIAGLASVLLIGLGIRKGMVLAKARK
jgi:hypothetical protein